MTWTIIEHKETSGTSITFSNIPQTYTDLVMQFSARVNINTGGRAGTVELRPNGLTTNIAGRRLRGLGTPDSVITQSTGGAFELYASDNTMSPAFSTVTIYIKDYKTSNSKMFSIDQSAEGAAANPPMALQGTRWNSSDAITSLEIYYGSSIDFGFFTLYGISSG